ncbi:T9SS type A sorting domain-containing protein [uncultured Polaribacter sp.]|uniref:T9SS type A sorting domain-containing protein n=1 Tax=uncultured Polaribacter sp. TaxID=174711 RepID=UPI00259B4C38|nr:T9SS type A sorting domain-containing protein [uncultured Polaribacter sp.]
MKKIYKVFTFLIAVFTVLNACQKEKVEEQKEIAIKEVKIKQKKKDPNVVHKKGIEHIAEYQKQIRKLVDEENSTYEKGYLIREYNKARKEVTLKKGASSVTAVFTERGPVNVPGRCRGVAVDPTNSNRWFVGTVGGGVWLTEDAGSTWKSLTDTQIPNLATSTVIISPQDANTIYAGTGEPFRNLDAIGGSGVFKSTDGGVTWQHLTTTISLGDVGRMIINPNDKDNVLIATTTGIYRTVNGGTSWSRVYNSSGRRVQDLDADPSDFNIQYGSVRNLGIVKSTDGGVTWATVFDRATYNSNHDRFETSVSQADPNTVFLSVYSPTRNNEGTATVGVNTDFYVSRDKGATFTNLQTTGTKESANLVTGQGWYDNVIMGHPYNKDVFYVGGVAVFKVTIDGNNFTSQSIASGYDSSQINSSVHVDQHGLFTILGNNQEFKILLANDGGVYSTSSKLDPGATEGDWSAATVGKNSTQFYGASKQNGQNNYLAGAQDNGSWISQGNNSDKTKSYTKVLGGDGFNVIWHYDKPGSFLVASQYNNIARYVNYSGASANTPDSRNSSKSPFISKMSNADNYPDVVFTISTSGVWRSTDFAANWNLIPITENFTTSYATPLNVKVSQADPNIVWAGGRMTENGSYTMHVSQDNGKTFTKTNVFDNPLGTHNYYVSGMNPSYTERNRFYLTFSGQGAAKILKTEDLGNTWTDISGFTTGVTTGFPDVAVHSVLEMPFDKNIIWAGTDIGIFQTTDGGANWSIVSGFIPVAVYGMKIVNDQVVIATHGRGVWSATVAELSSFTPAKFLKPIVITSTQKAIQTNSALISYKVSDDEVSRVKIYIDDVLKTEITQDFNATDTYTYETEILTEGVHKVAVQQFDDTNNLETLVENNDFAIVDFKPASPVIKITEFTAEDAYAYNDGFKIDNLNNNVTTNVLNNSEHPYLNNKTYSMVLKQPLTITATSSEFEYEDFAIVEPYTDDLKDLTQFYDYVIIEASKDLNNWVTLDKYDARRYPEWLAQSNRTVELMDISEALFKKQSINLTSKGFTIGDTVVFRLSLVTDPGTVSYGWAIKSINKNATASVNEVLSGKKVFTVYPSISNGTFTVLAKNTLGKTKMNIFDIRGRNVFNLNLDFSKNEKQKINTALKSGVYMVHITDENNKKSSKKIIIE